MPICRIHFNRNRARLLRQDPPLDLPCISIVCRGKTTQAYAVLLETATAIHGKLLSCGATAYLETDSSRVRVFRRHDWWRLAPELFAEAPDTDPNDASVHPSIDYARASEFAFDAQALAANKYAASGSDVAPAIIIQSGDLTWYLKNQFQFDRPIQLIQSHPTLSSNLFGGIAVFGLTNSTLPKDL